MNHARPRRLRQLLPWLAVAVAVTWLHFYVLNKTLGRTWSVPVDDTYIHFQYAKSLVSGYPLSFQPGEGYSTGCTSPLYVLLLALPYALGLRDMLMVPVTLVLGGVWLLGTLLLLMRIGRQLHNPEAGRVAAVLWGLWGFTWYCLFCGMESGLWALVILGVLSLFIDWTRRADGVPSLALVVLAGLLPLTRPEGLALLGVLLVAVLWRLRRRVGPKTWRKPLLLWSLCLGPAVLYYLANRLLTGSFSTAGMVSKSLLHAPYFLPHERLLQYVTQLFETGRTFLSGDDPLFLGAVLAVPGLAAILALGLREGGRRVVGPGLVMALWLVILLLFASMHYIRIARWVRYYLPFFLLTFLGAGFTLSWAARLLRRPSLAMGAAAALVFLQGDSTVRWMKTYATDVAVIHQKQAGAARQAREILPAGSRLLVCDAGAIPYISGLPTFDIVGLTSPVRFNYFRNGVGSRFELFERLPEAKRPTHVAAYDFCLWPGARGPTLGMHHDMMLAPMAETGAGSGETPQGSLDGFVIVDRVDVADLESEHAHAYRLTPTGTIRDNVVHRAHETSGQRLITDGGRLVLVKESLRFSARAGEPVILVGRYTVGLPVKLRLTLAGTAQTTELDRTPSDRFSEVRITLPGPKILEENHLVIQTDNAAPYHVYHYFFLQKKLKK